MLRRLITIFTICLMLGGCGALSDRKVDPSTLKRTTQTTNKNGDVVIDFAPGEYGQKIQIDVYATCLAKVEADKERKHELNMAALESGKAEIMWAISMDNIVANITQENGKTMRNIWGKGEEDVCQPGTNMWDAVVEEAKAAAATQQALITTTGSVAKALFPDYFRFKIFEVFANNSSDTTTVNNKGDGNNIELTQKDEKVDINAVTTGEESPSSVSLDKSKDASTTNEAAEPTTTEE